MSFSEGIAERIVQGARLCANLLENEEMFNGVLFRVRVVAGLRYSKVSIEGLVSTPTSLSVSGVEHANSNLPNDNQSAFNLAQVQTGSLGGNARSHKREHEFQLPFIDIYSQKLAQNDDLPLSSEILSSAMHCNHPIYIEYKMNLPQKALF